MPYILQLGRTKWRAGYTDQHGPWHYKPGLRDSALCKFPDFRDFVQDLLIGINPGFQAYHKGPHKVFVLAERGAGAQGNAVVLFESTFNFRDLLFQMFAPVFSDYLGFFDISVLIKKEIGVAVNPHIADMGHVTAEFMTVLVEFGPDIGVNPCSRRSMRSSTEVSVGYAKNLIWPIFGSVAGSSSSSSALKSLLTPVKRRPHNWNHAQHSVVSGHKRFVQKDR